MTAESIRRHEALPDRLRRAYDGLTGPGRRAAWRRTRLRRWAAAALVGVAAWVGLAAAGPVAHQGTPVVITTRDLPAGHRLAPEDLAVGTWRGDGLGAPGGPVADPGAFVGGVTASPIAAGELLVSSRLRGAASVSGLPSGMRAVHVPVADAGAVTLARPGDRVDVLAVGTGRVVGRGLLVLAADSLATSTPGGLFGGAASSPEGVVLAVPPGVIGPLVQSAFGAGDGSVGGPVPGTAGVHLALLPRAAASG